MITKIVIILLCIILAVSIFACKKKEQEQPVPQAPSPMTPGTIPPGQMPLEQMPPGQMMQGPISPERQDQFAQPGMMMPKGQTTTVIVPDFVKGKWNAAKILVEDKVSKAKQEFTVKLNSDFKIPNSNLKIHIGEFLPDFRMDGVTLTSGSNETRNPALGIRIYEHDKQIFPVQGRQWGWLFAKVPSIHRFEHPKYSITLKKGIKKG